MATRADRLLAAPLQRRVRRASPIAFRALVWTLNGLLVACAIGATFLNGVWHVVRDGRLFVDWQTYALAWQRVVAGEPIFAAAQLAGPYQLRDMVLIGYAYPPPSVLLFAPFASYPVGLVAWTVVNVGLPLTAVWALLSRHWPGVRLPAFAVVVIVLAFLNPWLTGIATGNASLAIAGAFLWGWLLGPEVAGVSALGLALTKVTAGVMVGFAAREGHRRLLPGLAIAGGITIVTLPIVGLEAWSQFFSAMGNAVQSCPRVNPSPSCFIPGKAGIAFALLCGGTLALAAYLVQSRTLAFVLAVAAYLAAAGDLHGHNWVAALLAALVVIVQLPGWVAEILRSRRSRVDTASSPPP